MPVQIRICDSIETPNIQWKDFTVVINDAAPDAVIPFHTFVRNRPFAKSAVVTASGTLRLDVSQFPPVVSVMAMAGGGQKVYFGRDIDLVNDTSITLYAIDESGAGSGGGGGSHHVAGTVTIDDAPRARSVLVISDDTGTGRKVLAEELSGSDGLFDIAYTGWTGPVIVLAVDNYGAEFQTETALNGGDIVHPTVPNGYVYEVTASGTTGTTEPQWPSSGSVQSGSVTFNTLPYYRPVASGPLQGAPV